MRSRAPDRKRKLGSRPHVATPSAMDLRRKQSLARWRMRKTTRPSKQPCLVCGRRPADAHHLRFAQSKALGRKVSDEFTVPLCRGHHREVHRCGDEAAWWDKTGINPTATARLLWLQTHPLARAGNSLSALHSGEPKTQIEANSQSGPR